MLDPAVQLIGTILVFVVIFSVVAVCGFFSSRRRRKIDASSKTWQRMSSTRKKHSSCPKSFSKSLDT
jgi:Na+/melibiose symporter-like transporter